MGQGRRSQRDGRARVRLLEAQRAEAKALTAVERAVFARDRAQRKFEAVRAAQEKHVADAEQRVAAAQAALVDVSGLERAAQLLDLPARKLRSAVKEASSDPSPEASCEEAAATKDQSCTPVGVGRV